MRNLFSAEIFQCGIFSAELFQCGIFSAELFQCGIFSAELFQCGSFSAESSVRNFHCGDSARKLPFSASIEDCLNPPLQGGCKVVTKYTIGKLS